MFQTHLIIMSEQKYFCVNKINGYQCENPVPPLGFICEECYNNRNPVDNTTPVNNPTINHTPVDNTTIYQLDYDNNPLISVKAINHVLQRNGEVFASGMYRDITNGLIISISARHPVVVVGYTNHHDDSEILPLTPEKVTISTSLTFDLEPISHILRRDEMVFESRMYRDITSGLLVSITDNQIINTNQHDDSDILSSTPEKIVSITDNQIINTLGYTNHHDDIEILPLTPEKIDIATSLGFNILSDIFRI